MRATLVALLCLGSVAAAEPRTLRMAAIAPEGTSWARELKALARDVETATHGDLKMKWYLGGIAGDELAAVGRIRKGQLDGAAGAIFCQSLASSMRVMRLPGLFHTTAEALYIMGRLKGDLDEEFRRSGFANLGEAGFGFDIILSREPVHTLADLRRGRFWVWSLDEVMKATMIAAGLKPYIGPVEEAGRAYEREHLDGLFAEPAAALAYQWSTEARYFTVLPTAFLPGCLVVSNTTFDALPLTEQQALRSASAKFFLRFDDVNRATEEALLGGLFEKQGLKRVEASPKLLQDYLDATASARTRLGDELAPRALLEKVDRWLSDYRQVHAERVPR